VTTVGIRALKSQLSRYVALAAAGETVLVQDRGQPVVLLGPIPKSLQALEELKRKGLIRWTGRKPSFERRKHWQSGDSDPGVSRAVVEDRR